MQNSIQRLAWLAFGCWLACCRPCPAADEAPLTLTECRLEHPLRLNSISARCGTLRVAEDPAHPQKTIELHIAVVPALNRRTAAPPLVLLAGGPGQSAGDLYVSFAGAFARSNRNRDLVLVDQRGTGQSAPLTCTYPDDWDAVGDPIPALRQATSECLKKYGDRVRFYTTTAAVHDLEQVRTALGYSLVDLYASSYGTRVAQLYMRLYPHSIHAVVLDGVTYPEQVVGPDTPLDGERALDLILKRCATAHDCATAFPQLRQELVTLRTKYGTEHTEVTLDDPLSGVPMHIDFNRGILGTALRFLSYGGGPASLLPNLLHQAALGNLAPLTAQTVMMVRQVGEQLAIGMQNSVICSEDVPYYTEAHMDRSILARTYQGTEQVDGFVEICKLWPRGSVDPQLHAPLRSEIPTLLLSGEADPVTPPQDAARAALGLTHHRLIVVAGEGHGQIVIGCMPRLMAEFLDAPDPAHLNTSCIEQHRPSAFFVSTTGPSP